MALEKAGSLLVSEEELRLGGRDAGDAVVRVGHRASLHPGIRGLGETIGQILTARSTGPLAKGALQKCCSGCSTVLLVPNARRHQHLNQHILAH